MTLSPEQKRSIAVQTILAAAASAAFILAVVTESPAHEAMNMQGEKLGIVYPGSCCNSAATSPTGDCAPIGDQYVTERSDGYHIDLPIGAHPKLKTKGYSGIVPYSQAKKQPLSNDYHICLSDNGAYRYCFFPKPGNV